MRDERQIMHNGDGQRAMFSPVVWVTVKDAEA